MPPLIWKPIVVHTEDAPLIWKPIVVHAEDAPLDLKASQNTFRQTFKFRYHIYFTILPINKRIQKVICFLTMYKEV